MLAPVLLFAATARGAGGVEHCETSHAPLVIEAGRALLGRDLREIADAAVVIERGRITQAGPRDEVRAPEGARRISIPDGTLLPGLVDVHAHLVYAGQELPPEYAANSFAKIKPLVARQWLRAGVTTFRDPYIDLAGGVAFRKAACPDDAPFPRAVIVAGAFVGGLPADRPSGFSLAVGDIAAKLDRATQARIGWVKVLSPDRIEPATLDTLVTLAHDRGLKVSAHGLSFEETRRALGAGVDAIEHLAVEAQPRYPQDIIDAIAARRTPIYWVPTYASYFPDSEDLDDPLLGWGWPAELTATLLSQARAWNPSEQEIRDRPKLENLSTLLLQLRSLPNVVLLPGSESGTTNNFPIHAMWDEIHAWQALGIEPRAVLRAATVDSARMLDAQDLGAIEPGARGDVLVLARNPLREKASARDVELVVKGGSTLFRK
jgi:imidazolonepropionase-like amidohydrolase